MFMSDVNKKDEIKAIALQDLRKLGVKTRLPKKTTKQQTQKNGSKVFKVPLPNLPTLTVTLRTGQQIVVPKILHELCSFIIRNAKVEGLFRKEGSKPRQNDIKLLLNAGSSIYGSDYNVLEMAAVLKTFIRELPEPLIPYSYHDSFLKCVLLSNGKLEAIMLTCLLLPNEHLNALSYLMQFFKEISEYHRTNKMTSYNLAVCIGPSVFPVEDKVVPNPKLRTTKTAELFEILIDNAISIGVLPESIIERIGKANSEKNDDEIHKKKKRRSGSLTRMFNGLRKMVSGKSEETVTTVTPDLLMTPINRSNKRRKVDAGGMSIRKKKEVLNKLPEKALLNTPFTPIRTPVNMNSNGNCNKFCETKEKRSMWYLRSKSVKNLSKNEEIEPNVSKLERRWSAVSSVTNLRKNKKRNSYNLSPTLKTTEEEKNKEEKDYVRVPKVEYEEIKNRVSAIERRISMELENVQLKNDVNEEENDKNANVIVENNLVNVQTAYEQTLVQAKLSPTTDHLAKRLSRELKIRRSAEQKIIRSPSARKIGSMRRRSKEMEKSKITRNQSWHVETKSIRRPVLKRESINIPQKLSEASVEKCRKGSVSTSSLNRKNLLSDEGFSEKWTSAEGFFSTNLTPSKSTPNDRSSLAQLRCKNAGMVLAKAKLFDGLVDSDSSNSMSLRPIPRVKYNNKIGSNRTVPDRISCRVKQLKNEKITKKTMSPRRRNTVSLKQKMQNAKLLVSEQRNKENQYKDTPNRGTPVVKRAINVKSPKRLCRTPGFDRNTPLKVLSTPKM